MHDSNTSPIEGFITKWKASGGAERANYVMFLTELCDVLGVPSPDPTVERDDDNHYVFEKAVTFRAGDGTTSVGWIDLYKADCFVLEAKQGSGGDSTPATPSVPGDRSSRRRGTAVRGTPNWLQAMERARGQAEQYARALPGWPPFLIVLDVGHAFALFANFARDGKAYLPFPDPRSHRFSLDDLADDAIADRLRRVWTDPLDLDPSRHAARVTVQVAARLATLAQSFELRGHSPELVADFLMRCLFTMFAEDVGLLPPDSFTTLLAEMREQPGALASMMESLWTDMDRGGFSPALRETVLRFNGRFFRNATALPLDRAQIDLLLDAARADWSQVEPSIFGTLLERALVPSERHALGAHYTPRTYVERLVFPTVIEPLREQWQAVKVAAMTLVKGSGGEDRASVARHREAVAMLNDFRKHLSTVRVLDPACGTGNFLYVTLEHIKRLEGEVLETLADIGSGQEGLEVGGFTVDPHQFLGIEKNPRAAAIAELVLWIGHLQWQVSTARAGSRGRISVPEPVLRDFHNIECRDAVLAYDAEEIVLDEAGKPVTVWDGETTKKHPVTGKEVPDDTARKPLFRYVNARKAEWPEADFIVSNPPFLGNKRMRAAFGDGYVDALRTAHRAVPDSSDYVMYWWSRAAQQVSSENALRFGLITTNSITQKHGRAVTESYLRPHGDLSIRFAVPDHPWVDTQDGAAVRIAMTVVGRDGSDGTCGTVTADYSEGDERVEPILAFHTGAIGPDLRIGADPGMCSRLSANTRISYMGITHIGNGFKLTEPDARTLGYTEGSLSVRPIVPFFMGRDLAGTHSHGYIIDFFGLDEESARTTFPQAFQRVVETVLPVRRTNPRPAYRVRWWLFGEPREGLRVATAGLRRYIATTRTSPHRVFQFVAAPCLVDSNVVAIASDDAYVLGILSSRVHVAWSARAGGKLEDRPHYTHTTTFGKFPFPVCTPDQTETIRALGEAIDAHRKRQQALHSMLKVTAIYNIVERLRSGDALTTKDKKVHEQGLCSVLQKLHDDLDAAVCDAYGWPSTLSDDEILERLVALNLERADEERRGLVRWLRPDFQAPILVQSELGVGLEEDDDEPEVQAEASPAAAKAPEAWPATLVERVRAIGAALAAHRAPAAPDTLARQFKGARTAGVADILETLAALGQARKLDDGRFTV